MMAEDSVDPGKVYKLEKHVGPSVQVIERECGEYCFEEWKAYEWRESGENGGCELFCLEGGILRRLRRRWERLLSGVGGDDGNSSTNQNKSSNTNHSKQKSFHKSNQRKLMSTPNNLRNLVIPIKFANHASRPSISKSTLHTLFNSPEPVPGITPTGSVRQYFAINSYGQFQLQSVILDWIRVKNTEQYYAGKKSGVSPTFHESLVEALNQLDSDPNFDFRDYDTDGDGVIDSIFFVHSGYSAEWGGVDCINGNDRSNRIWSHKWKIGKNGNSDDNMGWVSKSGVRVDEYGVSSALFGVCGVEVARIGTIVHEMGRLFGEHICHLNILDCSHV